MSARREIKRKLLRRVCNYAADHDDQIRLVSQLSFYFRQAVDAVKSGKPSGPLVLFKFMRAVDAEPFQEDPAALEMIKINRGQPRAICVLNMLCQERKLPQAWHDSPPLRLHKFDL